MFILLFLIIQSIFANIDFDRRLLSPRTLALSGAMTSRIALNESLYYNPASSAFSKLYSIEGVYGFKSIEGVRRIDNYNASIVDTTNKIVGAGFAFTKRSGGNKEWDFRGNLNKLFFKNRVSFGVGVNYTNYQVGDNLNLDLGVLALILENTSVGATFYNIAGDKYDIKTRSIALGIRHSIYEMFSFAIDFEHKFKKKTNLTGSFEFLYKEGFMAALSFKTDNYIDTYYIGAGLGYIGPKVSIIYGTMNSINNIKDFIHSFSFRVFF